MRRLFSAVLAVFAAASVFPPLPGQASAPSQPEFDGFLVQLRQPRADTPMFFSAGSEEEILPGLYRMEDPDTIRGLSELGLVEYCEPNYLVELLDVGSAVPDQWNLTAIHASAAWDHVDSLGRCDLRGDGVTVAVIDSGVYREHSDFNQEHILPYHTFAYTDGTESQPPTPIEVDVYHGTGVAGVIAAQLRNGTGIDGMAPNANILPICITKGGRASIATMVKAIDYALEQNVDVINLSMGGRQGSESLRRICQSAAEQGVIVVAAAGNYKGGAAKSDTCVMYPAAYDCVVSVSACRPGRNSGPPEFDDSYSYFNHQVTVSAPGTAISSLYVDGGTAVKDGTSYAAPAVSAMAAIAKQRCPSLSPENFTRLLCGSALDLGAPGYDPRYGYGFADMEAFVAALDQTYSVVCDLNAEDAAYLPEDLPPACYRLGPEPLPLPTPVRPNHHFLGWRSAADPAGPLLRELPAGSIGDQSLRAVWQEARLCFFAQYSGSGQLLDVQSLPAGTESPEDAGVAILNDAVRGSLFWLDQPGGPRRPALSFPLNLPPTEPTATP